MKFMRNEEKMIFKTLTNEIKLNHVFISSWAPSPCKLVLEGEF